MSAQGLRSALAALDAYWADRDPSWATGLPLGLSDKQVSSAEAALKPMLLTDEHRVLYSWHDGDGDNHVFGEDWPYFMPIADAIEWWRFGRDELGWTPCWLPLMSFDKQYWIALVDSVRQDSAGVFNFWVDDDPKPLVPSIEARLRWHLDSVIQDVRGNRFEEQDDAKLAAVETLRERYSGPILVRGVPVTKAISAGFTRDWPSAWKQAIGIDEAAEVPLGATTTVADLISGAVTGGVISGRVSWFGGGGDWGIVQIDDGTGRVLVACPKGIPGARDLGMELVVELTVRPRVGDLDPELALVEDLMGHPSFVAESVRFVHSLRAEDADPRIS